MTFDYLGTQITSYGFLSREVIHQANKAVKVSACLNDTIWYNKFLRQDSKVKIYKAIIRPILTYASETRPDTTKTKQTIETAEMQTLRKITRTKRIDHKRSEDIRQQCNIEEIGAWVLRRRIEWNEHIDKMEEGRLVKVVRDNRPAGKRSPERPRKRWKESLEGTG